MQYRLTVAILLLFSASLFAQEAVIIGTGLSDRTYAEGTHESSVAVVVPAGGANTRGLSMDVTNLTDPRVCVTLSLEESFDGGKTREFGGSVGVCGIPGGFKDKSGRPISSVGFDSFLSTGIPAKTQLFSVMEILGAPLRTNSAIKIKEVR